MRVQRLRLRIAGLWKGVVVVGWFVRWGRMLCRPWKRDVVGLEVDRRIVRVEGQEIGIE